MLCLQKLIKRTVFTDHLTLLTERQDVLLAQLATLAKDGFEKAKEEWERSVVAWGASNAYTYFVSLTSSCPLLFSASRIYLPFSVPLLIDRWQEKSRLEAGEASTGTGSGAPTRHPTEEMDVDGAAASQDGDGAPSKDKDGKHSANDPPAKRYRMTDQMKAIVWELVLLSNECCRLENEKKCVLGFCQSLEGDVDYGV